MAENEKIVGVTALCGEKRGRESFLGSENDVLPNFALQTDRQSAG